MQNMVDDVIGIFFRADTNRCSSWNWRLYVICMTSNSFTRFSTSGQKCLKPNKKQNPNSAFHFNIIYRKNTCKNCEVKFQLIYRETTLESKRIWKHIWTCEIILVFCQTFQIFSFSQKVCENVLLAYHQHHYYRENKIVKIKKRKINDFFLLLLS